MSNSFLLYEHQIVGKQLETKLPSGKKQYLSDYKLEDRSEIFVVFQLPGGNDPEPEDQHNKDLDDAVELSDAPDMITWDDDPENKRAKMPCGHAIGMYNHVGLNIRIYFPSGNSFQFDVFMDFFTQYCL